jgi:hypothetical protein
MTLICGLILRFMHISSERRYFITLKHGHRHLGPGIWDLSPVTECFGNGLGPVAPVPDLFRHGNFFMYFSTGLDA